MQVLDLFHSPEFHIAQGRLRIAKIQGTLDTCLRDPRVAAHRAKV
ncbi:hypothetical protein GCM10009836_24350 [Pseudonocardia ailaonensis]|uniref:Uncharacterized protein n=1 Tax=Pseudonocardia ailaonensis TaxID=367279 RepID=A0ABN2MZI5_9PSEU